MNRYTYILASFLIASTFALATKNTEFLPFQVGIEAYEKGNYATAKTQFLAALETSETAAARHNLGLTELQLENPARAVWQLERARLLEPFNQSYHDKLNLTREQLGLAASTQEWRFVFSQLVSLNMWTILATISFWLLLAAITLSQMREKKTNGYIKLLSLFSSLALVLSLTAIWLNLKTLKSGIVIAEETTPLHAAPATAAPKSGFARPGERARLLDRHNNFYQVKTEGSATGWISGDDFQLLFAPKSEKLERSQ